MKTSWDKLMRYAPEREYPLAPLQPDEAARIVEQTMQKAGIKTKKRRAPFGRQRLRRPLRRFCASVRLRRSGLAGLTGCLAALPRWWRAR